MKKIVVMAAIIAFLVALLLFPHQLYDEFLWKYFIGPVLADALGHPVEYHGVVAREGYTIISEIFYAIGLLAAIYALYIFFEKMGIKPDKKFFISTLPFILLGSFGRVLEDSNLFKPPLSYFFSSPLIYLQISIYFSLALVFGIFIKKEKYFAAIIAILSSLYTIFYFFFGDFFKYAIHPLVFILVSLFSLYIYVLFDKKDYNASLFSFGILFFLPSFLVFLSLPFKIEINFQPVICIALLASFIIAIAIFAISKYVGSLFHEFINSSIIFSHSLDGFTTWMVVANPFDLNISYGEKHPLPAILLKYGNGIAYPVLKILIILLIIYAINDLKATLKNTIKWLLLFLGLAPGLRDFLRVLIGV